MLFELFYHPVNEYLTHKRTNNLAEKIYKILGVLIDEHNVRNSRPSHQQNAKRHDEDEKMDFGHHCEWVEVFVLGFYLGLEIGVEAIG